MSLAWEDLNFTTEHPLIERLLAACCCCCGFRDVLKTKHILNGLSGSIKRGELIALMGPSGAGKSTLLNCITQGEKYKGFEGKITISGLDEPVRASFINQDEKEHLLLTLTVSQSLRYASQLKNPSDTPGTTHDYIVKELIRELELDGTEETTVRRCSGGQRKRLAIAMELTAIAKPHFLFLDEPTSGLDSYVGFKVVELLSRLTNLHNMAIVATIHQPSYKLFSLFTRAYVISGAGDFIYTGSPCDLTSHIANHGYPLNNNCENPADIVIELASAMTRDRGKVVKNRLNGNSVYIVGEDQGSQVVFPMDFDVEGSFSNGDEENAEICYQMVLNLKQFENDTKQLQSSVEYVKPFKIQKNGLCKNGATFGCYNLWILFLRSGHTSIWKQKRFILIRLALHAIVAIVLAALYNRDIGLEDACFIKNNSINQQNIPDNLHQAESRDCSSEITQAKIGRETKAMQNVEFQFFSLLFLMFAALMPTVLTFPTDIKLFLNEFRNGWYSSSSYYISKTITEIPLQLLFPFLYTYFLYWFTQQPGMENWYGGLFGFMSWRYGRFLLVTTISCFIAQGLGFLIGILCVRSFNISIIVSSSVLLFLFLFSGFFVKRVQMEGQVSWITCLSFIRFSFESLLIIIYGKDRCIEGSDSSVLTSFGLEDENLNWNICILVVHLITIRLMAFLALKFMANPDGMIFFQENKFLNWLVNAIIARTKPASKNLAKLLVKIVRFCLISLLIQIIVGFVVFIVHLAN